MSNPTDSHEGFRRYLPDLSQPRFTTMAQQDAHEYARSFLEKGQPHWLFALWQHWRRLFHEPFKGVTNDGTVRPGLFQLQDEGIDVPAIGAAAAALLHGCDSAQRARLCHHLDSPEWRSWSNPELLLSDKGLRLDVVATPLRDAALAVVRASLSPEGYAKATAAMRLNAFLGELVHAPRVMNEHSYNFVLFGTPSGHEGDGRANGDGGGNGGSASRPWGWALYGHHLCLNVFLYGRQIVVSPWFTGAEPNVVDAGPYEGTRILQEEERLGLALMQGLAPKMQRAAQVYELMNDPKMPPGRWNKDDQRHLCGAYRDNRVVPYEGVVVADMSHKQQEVIWAILEQYLLYLPAQSRRMKLEALKTMVKETYFCWIGGFKDEDPFYYRIQSPLVIVEFDHHSGVFLNNAEPAKFHIHTILRTPNAGDYGMAIRPLIPPPEDKFVAVL